MLTFTKRLIAIFFKQKQTIINKKKKGVSLYVESGACAFREGNITVNVTFIIRLPNLKCLSVSKINACFFIEIQI